MKSSFPARPRFAARPSWLMVLALGALCLRVEAKPHQLADIADTLAANPITTQMEAMVQGSEMVTFLSSRGPFTVFVPTDAAFAKLPPGTLATLLRPENKERLQHILLFHVVNGKAISAKDLLKIKTLLSCEGTTLTLKTTKSGTQFVLKAKIVHGDIRCENGVIHEVDTLLMPPESALPPLAPAPPPSATPAATNAPPISPLN